MLGVYKNLSSDAYHNDRTAVSRSGLWEFRKSPAKYWNAYINPDRPEKKDTPDMAFGRAFHTFVLEPHLFEQQYCVQDFSLQAIDEKPLKRDLQAQYGKDRGAKLYEEAKEKEIEQKYIRDRIIEKFNEKASGKEIITLEQMKKLNLMKESVLKHPQAERLIFGGLVEHSLFWEDPHSGIRCKTRPDVWHENMTVDLKTTASADERYFASSIASFGYHLQSAMNREGIFHNGGNDIRTHTFVCVEKEWPYLVAVYILDQNALDYAHNMFKNTLQQFKECVIRDEWPSYETKEISLPAWAL